MKLEYRNVNLKIGNKQILNDISLLIAQPGFYGVIGPNGSGKSTMLKCLYRVLEPTAGCVLIDDKSLQEYSLKETALKQAVLSQHNYCNFDFSVLEVVLMGRTPYKKLMDVETQEDYQIARESLKIVGMLDFADKRFSVLSGGEQQRVMLARALTQKTDTLILDEPTNHLDVKYQLQMLNVVKNRTSCVIAVLHDLNIAATYCDKIIAMKDGHIIKIGTVQEIINPELIYELFEVETEIIRRENNRLVVIYKTGEYR